MCDIPVPVENRETIVRALRECHVRKGKLRNNVFRGRSGTDEVSVMRHTYLGSDACKKRGKEIASGDPDNPYVGIAAIPAECVRSAGSEVTDSREEFCGHSHISPGMVETPGEPPPPELLGRLHRLVGLTRLLIDPDLATETWAGEQIEARV